MKTDLTGTHMMRVFKFLFSLQMFIVGTSAISKIVASIFAGMFLKSDAVAAIGLFGSVLTFISALSTVLSSGITVLCGKAVSDGTKQDMDRIFTTSVIFGAVVGLVATAALLSSAFPLAKLLGASDHVASLFVEYTRGMSIGIVFMVIVPLLMSFLQFGHRPQITIQAILILMITSIALDYIMIVPLQKGIWGMAVASSASYVIAFVFITVRFVLDRDLMRIKPSLFSAKLIGRTVAIGSPGAVSYIMWALRDAIGSRLAANMGGDLALTAMSVRNTVDSFTSGLFNVALSGALLILLSVMVAEENREAIVALLKRVLLRYLPIWIILTVAMIILADPFASIYVEEKEVSYVGDAIRGFLLTVVINYPIVALIALYKSLRKTVLVNILYVFNSLIIPIGFAFAFMDTFGVPVVWNMFWVTEAVTAVILFVLAWIHGKKFPRHMDDFCLFPEGFGVPESECMSFALQNMSEVMQASEKVVEFCKSKGIASGRAMRVGLCIEEMAGNIVRHGFSKPHRYHENDIIDIRLCYKAGDMVLRIWDNAPVFNPYTRVQQENAEPGAEIGIRMVFKAVKEAEYRTCFNQNILTLKV